MRFSKHFSAEQGAVQSSARRRCGASGLAALAGAAALAAAAPAVHAATADPDSNGDGRYIVVYEDAVGDPSAATRQREVTLAFKRRHIYKTALKGFSATLAPGQVRRLRADPR